MPEDSQRLQGFRSYTRLHGRLCQQIFKGYKVSEVTRLHSRLCQQIFKGYRVAEVAKVAQGYARRFSKVTRFQKLRGCAAGLYHPVPQSYKITQVAKVMQGFPKSKVKMLQKLQGYTGPCKSIFSFQVSNFS